jgi:hypothetical protein
MQRNPNKGHPMSRIIRRGAGLALITALALAVMAPIASAHEVKIVGGKTKLALSSKAKAALESLGITAKGTTYTATGGVYSFHPLHDGGGGTIKHSGSLTLTKGSTTVKLSKLMIDIPAHEHEEEAKASHGDAKELSAVVGGKRVEIATLGTKGYKPLDEDPGFTGLKVVLNKAAAKLLNQRFDTTAFKKGLVLGTLSNASKVKEIPE